MSTGEFYGATDAQKIYDTLTLAADIGVTFWDTADVYSTSEVTIGEWFTETGRRSQIFLATKYGPIDLTPDAEVMYKASSKPTYIKERIAVALKNLETDYIDLFHQHKVDPEVPIQGTFWQGTG